jgi:hypothetical protein
MIAKVAVLTFSNYRLLLLLLLSQFLLSRGTQVVLKL